MSHYCLECTLTKGSSYLCRKIGCTGFPARSQDPVQIDVQTGLVHYIRKKEMTASRSEQVFKSDSEAELVPLC